MNLLNQIKEKVAAAFTVCGLNADNTLVRLSDRPDMSDYQANGALPLAKQLHQNPRQIAEKIAEQLRADSFFSKVSVDGPGFINMTVSDITLGQEVYSLLSDKTCGYERPDKPKTIVLDYGGPNVAKALHVGHLRPALIGESIKRICAFVGDKTIGDVHLGDWGKPMGLLITEIQDRQPDLPYFDPHFHGSYPTKRPANMPKMIRILPSVHTRIRNYCKTATRAIALCGSILLIYPLRTFVRCIMNWVFLLTCGGAKAMCTIGCRL